MDRFSKVDKAVDRFGYWFGAYTIMTGAFAWIARQMDAYNLGWPEAFFIGLFSAGFVVLIVSAGLVGWRFFNPITIEDAEGKLGAPPPTQEALTDAQVASLINAHLLAWKSDTLPKMFPTHSDIHARDEKLAALSDQMKHMREIVEGGQKNAATNTSNFHERLDAVAKALVELERKLEAWTREHSENQDERFRWIDLGFAAILNRDWHNRLFSELVDKFSSIEAPVQGGLGIIDGQGWLKSVKAWRSTLEEWLVIADYYAPETSKRVLDVPEHLYEKQWSFDEGPLTANQVHRFKETAVWFHNLNQSKKRVDAAIESAAFYSPSMKGRRDAPPRPNGDQ
ncbi:MAG: hypothetical protein HC788_08105 [Sphingopyxis sp.]|nr:hypothetical protein [Sphingopyxis sp.]